MSVGKIGTFQVESDNWALYAERLEQYFLVNNIKEELKVPTLITVMGGAGYELLVTLCTPDKPSSKKFVDLVKVMGSPSATKTEHFSGEVHFSKKETGTRGVNCGIRSGAQAVVKTLWF